MGSRFVFAITEGKNPGDFKSPLRRVWEIVDVIFWVKTADNPFE